ncbi:carbohydrate kinase family protein [Sinanaerobacter chloroacetimidivorans]|uniref:Carbohydrate kinase family protein n=1 Tax=Sinanaerobacter chloroacetimidivorans TaxID=2818044 RepID=A0A8J8B0D4_9FIRM|nr:carbohydrate kinase family protein [Sinanaerobacter chloroacetimidivorans]MBR0596501.1 carbohydrate kinase family protein [Sinanaerobacter chloroacetimidivorans]
MNGILICGGLLIDRYLLVDQYPGRGGDGYILDSFDVVGGCTVNVARTVKNLGATPYMVSSVGNDPWGNEIMDFMKKEQFPANCVIQGEGSTGYCLVFLEPDGERTFLTFKGCEGIFSDALISEKAENCCRTAVVTGYYLLDPAAMKLIEKLKKFKEWGFQIIFDPSPLVDKIQADLLEEMMKISDVIIPNRSEAKVLAGNKELEQWAIACSERGTAMIIKNGSQGGILYKKGKKIPYDAVQVDAIDTTGAGDSFTGSIAYSLLSGIPLEKGVLLAASSASVVATIKGPHGNFSVSQLTEEAQRIWREYQNVR